MLGHPMWTVRAFTSILVHHFVKLVMGEARAHVTLGTLGADSARQPFMRKAFLHLHPLV